MPTNNPDPPEAAALGVHDAVAALKSMRNLLTGGQNTGALRKMLSSSDPGPKVS